MKKYYHKVFLLAICKIILSNSFFTAYSVYGADDTVISQKPLAINSHSTENEIQQNEREIKWNYYIPYFSEMKEVPIFVYEDVIGTSRNIKLMVWKDGTIIWRDGDRKQDRRFYKTKIDRKKIEKNFSDIMQNTDFYPSGKRRLARVGYILFDNECVILTIFSPELLQQYLITPIVQERYVEKKQELEIANEQEIRDLVYRLVDN
jgi:hypothetical protein